MIVPVSILIPVRNEAANLPRCLASVRWADEVIVVDSHSTDATGAIAETHGARLVQFSYNGNWPKKKNWALENIPFKHEWVFILDADEVLPQGASAEIGAAVAPTQERFQGFWVNRRFMFMGRWLRHAYYPNWNLRLFKHKLGRYEKIVDGDTQSGDNEVHEHVVLQGETSRLGFEMEHYAFPTVEVFLEKHNRYSNWEARAAVFGHLTTSLQDPHVKARRNLRQISRHLPFRPFLRFCYVYFAQRAFLDGPEGYYFARLHAFYEFLIVAKTRELRKHRGNS